MSGLSGDDTSSIFGSTPGAGGVGDTNVPAASQLAGLGALPGLADLPSLAGLAARPPRTVFRGRHSHAGDRAVRGECLTYEQ